MHLRFILVFCFLSTFSFGQNLIDNPSFETSNIIPCGFSSTYLDFNNQMDNWYMITKGKSTIYSTSVSVNCVNHPQSNNPTNIGEQAPHSGDAYISLQTYGNNISFGNNYREYAQIELNNNLLINHKYYFEYYISLADNSKYASNGLSLHLSNNSFTNYNYSSALNIVPTTTYPGIITEKNQWKKISGFFVADSSYQYLTIGNFNNATNTAISINNNNSTIGLNEAIYFIDDILLKDSTCLIAANDTVICPGDSALLYSVSEQGVYWTTDTTSAESDFSTEDEVWVSPDSTTTYYVVSPCETQSVTVTVLQGLSPLISDKEICQGDFEIFNLPYSSYVNYTWHDGTNLPILAINTEGWIWVEAVTPCETFRDSAYITILTPPIIEPINDFYMCSDEDSLLQVEVTNYTSLEWNNGSLDSQILISPTNTYTLTAYNGECTVTEEFTVNSYDENMLYLGNDAIICEGDQFEIDFSNHLGEFEWHTGSTSSTFYTTDTGEIWLHYTYGECVDFYDTIQLNYYQPEVNFADTVVCPKTVVGYDLSNIISTKIVWNGTTESDSYSVHKPGIYTVDVYFNDCLTSDTFRVDWYQKPNLNMTDSSEWCDVSDVGLKVKNYQENSTFEWSTGETTPGINVYEEGTYTVAVTDSNCTYYLSIFLKPCEYDPQPALPNVFTPNEDGLNDFLHPYLAEEIGWYKYEIYSRWGILIYEGDNTDKGWDGNYKDKECNPGVYYFVFYHKSKYFGGKEKSPLKGNVHLIRN